MASLAAYQYTVTVFTPTYNRGHLLERVYRSLLRQTYRNFEWLIVDDGSVDNTAQVVDELARAARFPVRYIWKPNGGKHTAVNEGVRQARGQFFAILDSDDWYRDDALENMLDAWNSIDEPARARYSGVTGLFSYTDGTIVGPRFPADVFDSTDLDITYVHRITGDNIGMKRTDVMRQFPFPEDVGTFVTEDTIWNRMAKVYSTRFVNRVLAVAEYQRGGLSDTGRSRAVRNPTAPVLYLSELLHCGKRLPLPVLLKATANLIRYSLHAHLPIRDIYRSVPSKGVLVLCAPVGLLLVLRDRFLVTKREKRV